MGHFHCSPQSTPGGSRPHLHPTLTSHTPADLDPRALAAGSSQGQAGEDAGGWRHRRACVGGASGVRASSSASALGQRSARSCCWGSSNSRPLPRPPCARGQPWLHPGASRASAHAKPALNAPPPPPRAERRDCGLHGAGVLPDHHPPHRHHQSPDAGGATACTCRRWEGWGGGHACAARCGDMRTHAGGGTLLHGPRPPALTACVQLTADLGVRTPRSACTSRHASAHGRSGTLHTHSSSTQGGGARRGTQRQGQQCRCPHGPHPVLTHNEHTPMQGHPPPPPGHREASGSMQPACT